MSPKNQTRSGISALTGLHLEETTSTIFNYTITALKNLTTKEAAGVIVILEDASAIEELNAKLKSMQTRFLALTSPITTETSLQKCINKLILIASDMDTNSDVFIVLKDIIYTLKHDKLDHAELVIPQELKHLNDEIQSHIKEYTEYTSDENTLFSIKRLQSFERADINIPVDLENLRD